MVLRNLADMYSKPISWVVELFHFLLNGRAAYPPPPVSEDEQAFRIPAQSRSHSFMESVAAFRPAHGPAYAVRRWPRQTFFHGLYACSTRDHSACSLPALQDCADIHCPCLM